MLSSWRTIPTLLLFVIILLQYNSLCLMFRTYFHKEVFRVEK